MRNGGKPLREVMHRRIVETQELAKLTKAQIFAGYPGPRRKHSGVGRDKNAREGAL